MSARLSRSRLLVRLPPCSSDLPAIRVCMWLMTLRQVQACRCHCLQRMSSCRARCCLPMNKILHPTSARNCSAQEIIERVGVASLGALTALRNLKFDLAHHHSMSDDALRQLARLRLTSLSLPGLRLVSRDVGMHATRPSASHPACRNPLQGGVLRFACSHPGIRCTSLSPCCLQGDHGGALAELAACRTPLRELSIRGAARGPHLMAAVAGASLSIVLRCPILWLLASLHPHTRLADSRAHGSGPLSQAS